MHFDSIDWNFWCTIVTTTAAIIALYQSNKQTKLSNKQQLFDRRLEKYLIFKCLHSLYSQNNLLIKNKESLLHTIEVPFCFLTNCSLLEQMTAAIDKPLHQPEQKVFLTKIEMLEQTAVETEILWNNRYGEIAGHFIREYKELLNAMYKQQIIISDLNKENEQSPILLTEFEKRIKEIAEGTRLFDIIDRLQDTFQEIDEHAVEQNLRKSLRL